MLNVLGGALRLTTLGVGSFAERMSISPGIVPGSSQVSWHLALWPLFFICGRSDELVAPCAGARTS